MWTLLFLYGILDSLETVYNNSLSFVNVCIVWKGGCSLKISLNNSRSKRDGGSKIA
jgi:hypothetical protein